MAHIEVRKNSSCAIVGIKKSERTLLVDALLHLFKALVMADGKNQTKLAIQYINNDLVFPNVGANELRSILLTNGIVL